jgi:hypothetical protein
MTTTCDACGGPLRIGDYPFCNGDPTKHEPALSTVLPDDIPGGVEIIHGLCDEVTGAPRRYYSRSEMAAEAKRRGITNVVRHVGVNGTDKSPHTSRWI